MARNLPDSGEVVRISEIFLRGAAELDGQAVRVMGKLETHDIIGCTAELSNVERSKNSSPHQQLSVDTRLIEPFQARLGSIFQMIGETEFTAGGPLLHARVVRCVDGIDTAVYYKALDIQRQYLKQRQALHA
ncbi:CST complex subunit TEN1-like [Branchiostoma floridae x Branchiostoma japonicum]